MIHGIEPPKRGVNTHVLVISDLRASVSSSAIRVQMLPRGLKCMRKDRLGTLTRRPLRARSWPDKARFCFEQPEPRCGERVPRCDRALLP